MAVAMLRSLGFLAVLACASAPALAHTQDGSLGDAAAATDYYQVTCSDDGTGPPASLAVQVQHRGPGAAAVVMLAHRATAATSAADTGGDATPGPLVSVDGGDGVYNVFLSKAGTGVVNYTLTFHCMTGNGGGGLHTGSTVVFRQNQ
jgi:hypothetical protein